MIPSNHDAILAHAAAVYPGRKIRISDGSEHTPAIVKKIPELPYDQHDQVIAQLREFTQPRDRGLGDTCQRLLLEKHSLSFAIRRWLKFYSCRTSEAIKMVNRQFSDH